MFTCTLYLTVQLDGSVIGFYAFGDRPRNLIAHGMRVGSWREVFTLFHLDPQCRIVVRRTCKYCGSPRHSDESCGCFDNGAQ